MSKAWKAFERDIARRLGTFRTPLSGSNSRHTMSDTLHNDYYIEAKYFSSHRSLFRPIYNMVQSGVPMNWLLSRQEIYVLFHTHKHRLDRDVIFKPVAMTPARQRWGVWKFFREEVVRKAEDENKIPVLAIKKKAHKGEVVICPLKSYLDLVNQLSKEYNR